MTRSDENDKESKESCAIQGDSEQSRSRARAIRILGSRQLSSREIEKRLVNKGEAEDTAQKTVQWLESIGAVNDAEYAEAVVRHYSLKGYGLARIRDELYKRGIPRDLWDEAISCIEDADAENAATEFIWKKLKGGTDKNDMLRVTNALCKRGYSYDEARTAAGKYLESVENTEENKDMV